MKIFEIWKFGMKKKTRYDLRPGETQERDSSTSLGIDTYHQLCLFINETLGATDSSMCRFLYNFRKMSPLN